MTRSVSSWLIGAASVAVVALFGATAFLTYVNDAAFPVVPVSFLALVYMVVGALVSYRRPSIAIGWLLFAVPLFFGAAVVGGQYALLDASTAGGLPGAAIAGWLSYWAYIPGWIAMSFLVLLFPDGRLPSRGWSRGAIAIGLIGSIVVVLSAFGTDPRATTSTLPNPYGIPALAWVYSWSPLFYIVVLGLPVIAVFRRYRRADATTRLQLKWLGFGTLAVIPVALVYVIVLRPAESTSGDAVFTLALGAPALAIGIAVLRYRLYDIDVLINRTIVYGATVAVIGAGFVAAALVLQTVLRPLTAGSDLAIAVSTLATVAAFQPLRRRIQAAVDRRFYRSRYDAARTLDGFTTRMRDQVDLDAVRSEVLDVVGTTLQPAHASVWLRGAQR